MELEYQKEIYHVYLIKSFTGENGRKYAKSTGMGLYIAKGLCERLGHKIDIESEEGKYTEVRVTFGKNDYFDTVV